MSENKLSEKDITSIVKSEESTKKSKKFIRALINTDIHGIEDHLINEVIIPSIQDTAVDLIGTAADMIFNNPRGHRRRSSKSSSGKSQTAYNMCSRGRTEIVSLNAEFEEVRIMPNGWNIEFKYRDICTKFEESVFELMEAYHNVTVGDIYTIADMSLKNWAICNKGWIPDDFDPLPRIVREDGYYHLDLPKPKSIEQK